MADNNAMIAQFCGITGATPQAVCLDFTTTSLPPTFTNSYQAEQFLISSEWDLEDAAAQYYASQEEPADLAEGGPAAAAPAPPEYTGPRTLDGRPAPESRAEAVASSSRPHRQAARTGVATLGSLPSGAHGHDDDDSADEDYHDDEQPRDLFAGGEKSGLAVQDPRRNDPRSLVDDIIKKAKSYVVPRQP